jgi:hypothetical protein
MLNLGRLLISAAIALFARQEHHGPQQFHPSLVNCG